MAEKPIFVATHPRACSTAFERVFMTRRDTIQCVHEPFGEAYYYGPERLALRFAHDEKAIKESGFADSTFRAIMDNINQENNQGKRVLIKDMAQVFFPPSGQAVSIAPSLAFPRRGVGTTDSAASQPQQRRRGSLKTQAEVSGGAHLAPDAPYATYTEPGNPTVMPHDLLEQFHFAFLIRHPRRGVPSYYRCTIPPLDAMTGFYGFRSDEAGYGELRRLFDFVRGHGLIGPHTAGMPNGATDGHVNGATNGNVDAKKNQQQAQICVVDADDMLDQPAATIEAFCKSVGIEYDPQMLNWDTDEEEAFAARAFEKWKGFHEDAIHSRDLKPRGHKRVKSFEEEYADWVEKYGKEAAEVIRATVDENVEDYEYLKQFALKD